MTISQILDLDRWTFQEIYLHPRDDKTGAIVVRPKPPRHPPHAPTGNPVADFFVNRGWSVEAAMSHAADIAAEQKRLQDERVARKKTQEEETAKRNEEAAKKKKRGGEPWIRP